jgi:hypothetical protein
MSSQGAESIARRYVDTVGRTADDRYQLDIDQLIWLVEHCSRLDELRLGLLRDLQSALPSSQELAMFADLKELLTNLIIMETRVSDRSGRLLELLNQLTEASLLDRVSVDQVALTEAIQSIIEANGRVRAVIGDQI